MRSAASAASRRSPLGAFRFSGQLLLNYMIKQDKRRWPHFYGEPLISFYFKTL